MKVPGHLFRHYRSYHEGGLRRLELTGCVGAVFYALFLAIRLFQRDWTPQDVVPRLLAVVLFMALALRSYWPRRRDTQFIALSWVVLAYGLPFFVIFDALQRHGGVPAISNLFICLSLLVLLTDWRNTLAMLTLGVCLATALHVLLNEAPELPHDLVAQAPAFAVIVIGGSLFKLSGEQVEAARQLRLTQTLAGSVAHEVRNPLAQIRHSLSSLRRMLPRVGHAQEHLWSGQYVSEMHRHVANSDLAVQRGLQTISMTLDEVFDKPLDRQSFVRISAADLVRKAVAQYAYDDEAARSRVKTHAAGNFHFRGDETACLFMLFNLIRNALYYLPSRPQALVTITIAGSDILVHDSGPGISAAVRDRLFEPVSSIDRRRGTGLGLVYCKRVMTGLGGSIACESAPGRFTEFRLTFPVIAVFEDMGPDNNSGKAGETDHPDTEPPAARVSLLDERRLREYRRNGFLCPFVDDYVVKLREAVTALERAAAVPSGPDTLDAAHELLAITHDACTLALNQRAREIYVLLSGGASWPQVAPQWLPGLAGVMQESIAALQHFRASSAGVKA